MDKTYYKILLFMKRRPGMTMEAFEDYYENRHAPLAMKYGSGIARYVRRYLTPQPNPEFNETGELPYDVVTELWFEDEKVYRGTVEYLSTSIMPDDVVADEANLFDRPKIRMATVVERESVLPG
jgi:uncharacterized protein (TIGR02118 family)